jgi:hypothetical protein
VTIGASSRTTDAITQDQVRILSADGTEKDYWIAIASASGLSTHLEPADRIEVTRIWGTGEAPLVLGDARFSVSGWPLHTGP